MYKRAKSIISVVVTESGLNSNFRHINGIEANDFVAMDIGQALLYRGEITMDDLRESIFSKFCVGK